MSSKRVKLALGEKVTYDGEALEVTDFYPSAHGTEVLLIDSAGRSARRVLLRELLAENSLLPVGEFVLEPEEQDQAEPIGSILAQLNPAERELVIERARHIREVLTGYKSGSPELAEAGEPRPGFKPVGPLGKRLEIKAGELEVANERCSAGSPPTAVTERQD